MEIHITKGTVRYLDACEAALTDSELGRHYFSQEGGARKAIEEGFGKDEIFVALDRDQNCAGFVWVIPNGSFHSFPYIHIIAVKSEYRGQGIGKKLLSYIEELYFPNHSKIFLVVADFNPDAKRLYESIGYTAIGDIPDLYRKGITECLMMKARE